MFGLSDEQVLLLSFLLFMGFFAGVGLASMRVKQDTTDDYLVAGRGMHPALAALSAVSTWNSGYMFIGFIGFIFVQGYSGIWIGLVSTLGQAVADMALQIIQKEGAERVRSLSSLVGKQEGLSSKISGHPLGGVPRHLRRSATRRRRCGTSGHAWMVGNGGHPHRFRARCSLLLCGRYPRLHLDRCGTILCHDRWLNHPVLRGGFRSWRLLRPPWNPKGHRPGDGEPLSRRPYLRCNVVDWRIFPWRTWRGGPTSSCVACHDTQGRQGQKRSSDLVLRLANAIHRPHVHHWPCVSRYFPRPGCFSSPRRSALVGHGSAQPLPCRCNSRLHFCGHHVNS